MAFFTIEEQEKGGKFALFGEEGKGKTNLAKRFPKPLYFRMEKGLTDKGMMVSDPKNIQEFINDLLEIYNFAPDRMEGEQAKELPNGAKSVVIDTVTKLETYINEAFLQEHGIDTLADFGGRKAFGAYAWREAVIPKWDYVLNLLDAIQAKYECNIVLVCHDQMKEKKQRHEEGYQVKDIYLVNSKIPDRIRQWADVIAFIYEDVLTGTVGTEMRKQNVAKGLEGPKIGLDSDGSFHAKTRDFGGRVDIPTIKQMKSIPYEFEGTTFFNVFSEVIAR